MAEVTGAKWTGRIVERYAGCGIDDWTVVTMHRMSFRFDAWQPRAWQSIRGVTGIAQDRRSGLRCLIETSLVVVALRCQSAQEGRDVVLVVVVLQNIQLDVFCWIGIVLPPGAGLGRRVGVGGMAKVATELI